MYNVHIDAIYYYHKGCWGGLRLQEKMFKKSNQQRMSYLQN